MNINSIKNEKCLVYSEVILIDNEGKNLGKVKTREALKMAKGLSLDLVIVDPTREVPISKMLDYGKYQYEMSRKKQPKAKELKCITLRPVTGPHDLDTKIKHIRKFLEEGHKVKLECKFKRPELAHPDLGKEKLEYIVSALDKLAKPDKDITLEGRSMFCILAPL